LSAFDRIVMMLTYLVIAFQNSILLYYIFIYVEWSFLSPIWVAKDESLASHDI